MAIKRSTTAGLFDLQVSYFGTKWDTSMLGIAAGTWETSAKNRRPKPKGFLYPTTYYAQYNVVDRGTFGQHSWDTPYGSNYNANGNGYWHSPDVLGNSYVGHEPWVQDKAINGALLRMKEGAVDLGATVAELRETAGMISGYADNITKSYLHMRAGRFKPAMRALGLGRKPTPRDLAGMWLAYNWGVKPLVMDLQGVLEALEYNMNDLNRPLIKSKGSGFTTTSRTEEDSGPFAGTPTINAHIQGQISARCKLHANPETNFWRDLSNLGTINPLSSIWEGTFMSAVADWFLPIGDYLHALDATAGLVFHHGFVTSRTHAEILLKGRVATYWTWSGSYKSDSTGMKGHASQVGISRLALDGFPGPTFSYRKNPFDLRGEGIINRAITAVALTVGTIKGNPPPFVGDLRRGRLNFRNR